MRTIMKRRNFVNVFLGGSLLGAIGSLLYPVVRYLIPPKRNEVDVMSINVSKVGELAPNTAKVFKFGSIPGILIYTSDGEYRAFNAVCTHLTCTVVYESETETLLCPCHNGRFDLSGNVISGPPPSPLEVLNIQQSGEDIIISKKS